MNQFYDSVAGYYDQLWGDQADAEHELAFLRKSAGDGPALEIGIGTGRVAVPLARTGVRVVGVDPSPGMLAVLDEKRRREAGLPLEASLGDMTLADVTGTYSLIYCVYHSLFYADSREEQQLFFRRAAALLAPNGVVVVEGYVPGPKRRARWARGMHTLEVSQCGYDWELYRHDEETQTVRIGRHTYDGKDVHYSYWEERYLSPEQIDEFAGQAGLVLRERWRAFDREPFEDSSGRCVSVLGRRIPQRAHAETGGDSDG